MYFVIKYIRNKLKTVYFKSFVEIEEAQTKMFDLELELIKPEEKEQMNIEVVILEASDLKALRKTHNRYITGM